MAKTRSSDSSKKKKEVTKRETKSKEKVSKTAPGTKTQSIKVTATEGAPAAHGPLGIQGFSHLSVNVNDMEYALEFYHRVFGFEKMKGGEKWGDFDFRGMDMEEFAKNAGFMDGKVKCDCVWMYHPHLQLNLELFRYDVPVPKNRLDDIPAAHDIGGIKHASFVVEDIDKTFAFLKTQKDVRMITDDPQYKPNKLGPFPFKFFFCIDPFGCQWEFEEYGPTVVTNHVPSVTRAMDAFTDLKG